MSKWTSWLHDLLQHIRSNELDEAANILASCLPGEHFEPNDHEMAKLMFGQELVVENAKNLWPLMKPFLIPRRKVHKEVLNYLRKCGWQL